MTRRLLVAIVVACACQVEDHPDARLFADDALSVAPPAGWQITRQKDTLLFVGGSPADDARPTIAIRSIPVSGWSEPRTADNVLPSVETVLRALPEAKVKGPVEIDQPAYRAVAYEVVFKPRGGGGRKYERRHVVVFSASHIFHAFLTAPAGTLANSRATFDEVLASLREEA